MIFAGPFPLFKKSRPPRRTPANPFQEILKPFLTVQGGLKKS